MVKGNGDDRYFVGSDIPRTEWSLLILCKKEKRCPLSGKAPNDIQLF